MTNVLKHAAAARSVNISLTFGDPDMTVRIVDDGRPPMPAFQADRPSLDTCIGEGTA
jgi:anti-sigma regulatory factor (Ser/Thr protein kinase)